MLRIEITLESGDKIVKTSNTLEVKVGNTGFVSVRLDNEVVFRVVNVKII